MAARKRGAGRRPVGALVFGALLVLGVAGAVVWHRTRVPPAEVRGYAPRRGDLVFQQLPRSELATVIEGIGGSPWTHCGIVDVEGSRWTVVEAVGPVRVVPLLAWMDRGRGGRWRALRVEAATTDQVDEALRVARSFLGRPYDHHFALDDERIYCTELVHKAFAAALGAPLSEPEALGRLAWRPHEAWIRSREGGALPLDRLVVTPAGLLASPQLREVGRTPP